MNPVSKMGISQCGLLVCLCTLHFLYWFIDFDSVIETFMRDLGPSESYSERLIAAPWLVC